MNPPRTSNHPRRWLPAAMAAIAAACLGSANAATEYLNETLRDGDLPAGWAAFDVAFPTGAGGYANISGTTGALISKSFNAAAESRLTLSYSVAKFGSGGDGPLTIEYSLDGSDSESWFSLGETSIPTSSTYIDEQIEIPTTSANMAVRFLANNSPSAKRLRDVTVTEFVATPLAITSLSPANESTGVSRFPELVITFNQPVQVGTGNLTLHLVSGGSVEMTVPITASMISGNTLNVMFIDPLPNSTEYYVLVEPTVVTGLDGQLFDGITSPTDWTFTIEPPDTVGPVPLTFNPSSGAANVTTDLIEISAIFDEPIILVGSQPIEIRRVSDNAVADTIPTDDFFSVFVTGDALDELGMFPGKLLDFDTEYYVFVPAGTVQDSLGNPNLAFGGPSSDQPWTFTTFGVAALADETPYTEGFLEFVSAETLPGGWFADGNVLNYNGDWGTGFSSGFRGNASVLGYQHTGTTGELIKGVRVRNDTGAEITALTISYTGRAARLGETRSPAYIVKVDDVEAVALAYSTFEGDGMTKTGSVTGLSIAPGGFFEVTWTSDRDFSTGGSSKQIGISNVSIANGASLFPPVLGVTSPVGGSLTASSFEVTGSVTADNGAEITERGFVISQSAVNDTPEIGGTGVTSFPDATPELGEFSYEFMGLDSATSHSVRAYATNAEGTAYSNTVTLITLDPPLAFTGEYQQPFNGYDGSLPLGWNAFSSTGLNSYLGEWGTGTGGGFRGGVSSPGVLGYQHTGTSGTLTASLRLQNTTGAVIDELFVSYLGRVARPTEGRSPIWTVKLDGVEIAELSYSTESGMDETKSHMIPGLSIAPDQVFTLTWECERGLPGGSSKQIGIANVVINLDGSLPTNTFASWIAKFPGVGTQTGFFDDPDNDGIPNLLEHVLGLAPDVPNGAAMAVSEGGDGTVTLTHTRIKPEQLDPGVTPIYQWSTGLDTWAGSGAQVAGVTVEFGQVVILDDSHPDYDVVQVTATVTGGSTAQLFVRLLADPPA